MPSCSQHLIRARWRCSPLPPISSVSGCSNFVASSVLCCHSLMDHDARLPGFNDLPHALQALVFSSLSARTLAIASCVSRAWRSLAIEPADAWAGRYTALWDLPAASPPAADASAWRCQYGARQELGRCWLGRPATDRLAGHGSAAKACTLLPHQGVLLTGEAGWQADWRLSLLSLLRPVSRPMCPAGVHSHCTHGRRPNRVTKLCQLPNMPVTMCQPHERACPLFIRRRGPAAGGLGPLLWHPAGGQVRAVGLPAGIPPNARHRMPDRDRAVLAAALARPKGPAAWHLGNTYAGCSIPGLQHPRAWYCLVLHTMPLAAPLLPRSRRFAGTVRCIAADSRMLASGSSDHRIRVWLAASTPAATGRAAATGTRSSGAAAALPFDLAGERAVLAGHAGPVSGVQLAPDVLVRWDGAARQARDTLGLSSYSGQTRQPSLILEAPIACQQHQQVRALWFQPSSALHQPHPLT